MSPSRWQVVVYLSAALPEAVLREVFAQSARRDDVLLVFRGVLPEERLGDAIRRLRALMQDLDPLPNAVFDPVRFRKAGVNTVPELVLEAGVLRAISRISLSTTTTIMPFRC